MTLPVGGFAGIWGISGSGFADWFKPGVRGNPRSCNSSARIRHTRARPGTRMTIMLRSSRRLRLAGALVRRGKDYGPRRLSDDIQPGTGFKLDHSGNVVPGSTLNGAYAGDSSPANAYLDLTKVAAQVPVAQIYKPLQAVPLTDRTQQVYNPQANLRNPYAENVTLSVTRSLTNNLTLDVRYIGTLGRRQWNSNFQINQPNFLFNGLKEAFDAARAGNDSSPALQVLENMFKGINIAGTAGSGPVGSDSEWRTPDRRRPLAGIDGNYADAVGVVGNLQQNLANGNYSNVAAILNTLNYSNSAPGNSGLPVIPTASTAQSCATTISPKLHRRKSSVQQRLHHLRHQHQQLPLSRSAGDDAPMHGVSMQSTYTWSKNLGITAGLTSTYTDPLNRHADYGPLSDQRVQISAPTDSSSCLSALARSSWARATVFLPESRKAGKRAGYSMGTPASR